MILIRVHLTPIGSGLPSPAMMPFSRPILGLLLLMNEVPITIYNDSVQCEALEACQSKYSKNKDTHKIPSVFSAESTGAVQWEGRI